MMRRRGFTLTELLITVAIIGIMATMVLFAMFNAQETAKVHKTRALIAKLNDIVMRRYDEYRTRRVPFVFPDMQPGLSAAQQAVVARELARARLDCLRDLMRMEMPDRWSDVTDGPVAPFPHGLTSVMPQYNGTIARPAVSAQYLARRMAGMATDEHQGAECLYLIVMASLASDGDSGTTFKADEIGDLDGDGFPEFRDAWGRPIEFIRWPAGMQSALQSPIRITGDVTVSGQTATMNVTANHGPRLSQAPGSYVGGALVMIDPESQIMHTERMGRITGYTYNLSPPSVTFTCSTQNGASQQPFNGQSESGKEFLVLQPDPFDPRGAYPVYSTPPPDLSTPTFAIYPLIYSKGKDGVSGIVDDVGTIRYADPGTVRLNPFYVPPAITQSFGLMLGSVLYQNGTEPGWYPGCHRDNISSHELTSR